MTQLVLLSGLNTSPRVWTRVVAALPDDIETHVPTIPPLTDVDAVARTLLPELPERFFLAGFSFGGYVALAMHALAPERIEGVALVNSSALADDERTRELRRGSIARAAAGEHASLAMEQRPLSFIQTTWARQSCSATSMR